MSFRVFLSRIIWDLLRFSMGNDSGGIVVSELGVGNEISAGSGVELELEFEFEFKVHLIENLGGVWRRK